MRPRGGTFVTNLTHFLDERGCIAVPEGGARRLADFLTNIVATVTHEVDEPMQPIKCRRRPGYKPCPGLLEIRFSTDWEIIWECPLCYDNGIISGWENTFWDLLSTS